MADTTRTDTATVDRHLAAIATQGYTGLEDVFTHDEADGLVEDLDRLVRDLGVTPAANAF